MLCRGNVFLVFFLASLLALNSACKDKKVNAANELISAFRSGCQSQGRWSDMALSQNRALETVVQAIQDSDPCKKYSQTFKSITSASQQVNLLLSDTSYSNLRIAEERVQELTLSLQNSTDPTTIPSLQQAIATAQVDLADQKANYTYNTSSKNQYHYNEATAMLANTLQDMLKSTAGMGACLQQSPATAVQMASNLIAIGGSFISPLYGAGTLIIGQLLNMGVEYIKQSGTAAALWDLHANEMPMALACGMESMTELYCQANDALGLIQLEVSYYPTPGEPPHPIWRGLDLQGRRLPVLSQWLLSVKNGVEPSNPLEAQRQRQIWKKYNSLEDTYRLIIGELNYTKQLYDAGGTEEAKLGLLLRKITTLSQTLAYGLSATTPPYIQDASSPFAEFSSDIFRYACYWVVGPGKICPEVDTARDTTIESYVRRTMLTELSVDKLFSNWKAIYERVTAQVNIEFGQTITVDPNALLAAAFEPTPADVSPYEALVMIRGFLTDLQNETPRNNPQWSYLAVETLNLIHQVIAILNDFSESGDKTPDKNKKKIEEIFRLLKLGEGLQFFESRILNFVRWDIQHHLENGDFPKDVAETLRVSGQTIQERFLASGAKKGPVIADLNFSRTLTQGNIKSFRNYFEPIFALSVDRLDRAAREAHESPTGVDRPNGQSLAQLCTLILATGNDWPKDVSWEICSKTVLESIYSRPEQPLQIQVGQLASELKDKPYQYRMCTFHRYLRAERLAEILRTRPTRRLLPSIQADRPLNLMQLMQ